MSNPKNLRIVYAGTPDFALPPLAQLIKEGLTPVAVLTQPDRPAGRGRQLQASPVKQAAEKAGIKVFQPNTLKDQDAFDEISSLRPDLLIVVAYGLLLPQAVLDVPTHGCWNIHASLLPRWRGAAPIQRAIEAGDTETGVCIMQMDAGLDSGPVLRRVTFPLQGHETGGSLHDSLASLGADALLECVRELQQGSLPEPEPQSPEGVNYARKLVKSEAEIDWSEPARVLERRIRAFNPWPVAWCGMDGERTRIWRAEWVTLEHSNQPGTILAATREGIEIACGEQVLRLLELQRPGGRPVNAADYLNARQLPEVLDT